ncbi:probable leucine--tRNA ligase, mitochondrial [Macrobrachium rosenbergii]|uniref:probable leucine--tRNA ligase, mitochondrial n=1 Tax=Macrobrachium rosenbergii TaxID=79674 RepID=UPI0034D6C875
MESLRCVFYRTSHRKFLLSTSCRYIYSKTGIWPVDRELTLAVKKEAEAYWKKKYSEEKEYLSSDSKATKKYVLAMFPYPSGKLHMGHVRVYTISDSMARFYRQRGFKVIHPMGWDAFGLPAENAAIENKAMPDEWTYTNISQMKAQLLDLGCKFDWDCEFATCEPSYYKWTQYIFLLLYKAGLAYQQEALVNWDPVDQTVLAHEQVDENGRSWRSGALVEKKYLKQWFIKTTRFSKSLWDGLSDPVLEYWQDIPKIQKNWIGECSGYRVEMCLCHDNNELLNDKLHLWMSHPEYIHGISFIGVRSDHRFYKDIYLGQKVDKYQILNIKARCPITKKLIPVIVCDELPFSSVLEFYIGIPSLNDTDHSLARTCGFDVTSIMEKDSLKNSGILDGLSGLEAREKAVQELLKCNAGGYQTSAKLNDWLVSRQRYWGTPIPMIHCPSCGTVPVPFEDLPVKLPKITKFFEKGSSPLKDNEEWRSCQCPKCGGSAERETDTMDTFADSSWYFLRFLDAKNQDRPFDYDKQASGMPVDLYVGGKEHADLHMYYARFIQHFLASEGLVSQQEPFRRLVVQGMVMGQTYKVIDTGRYLRKEEVDFSVDSPVELGTGASLEISYEKMSKSKKNGIDPQNVLEEYGTDTMRLLMMANYAPFSQRNWSEETFPAVLGWQNRVWLTVTEFVVERQKGEKDQFSELSDDVINQHKHFLWESRNYSVRGATYNMQETHQISTSISFMQTLTASMRKVPKCMMLHEEFELALAAQIIMLSPITPHLASELWAGFCSVASSSLIKKDVPLLEQSWPEVDQEYKLPMRCMMLPSKTVSVVHIPRKVLDSLTESAAVTAMMNDKELKEYLDGKAIDSVKVENITPGISATLSVKTILTRSKEEQREINRKKKQEEKLRKEEKRLRKEERRLRSEEKKLKYEMKKKQNLKFKSEK